MGSIVIIWFIISFTPSWAPYCSEYLDHDMSPRDLGVGMCSQNFAGDMITLPFIFGDPRNPKRPIYRSNVGDFRNVPLKSFQVDCKSWVCPSWSIRSWGILGKSSWNTSRPFGLPCRSWHVVESFYLDTRLKRFFYFFSFEGLKE